MRTVHLAWRAVTACFLGAAAFAQSLDVGDPAPKLTVSSWAKGDPVCTFERENIYVVEFWATWCVPCRKSIPHLSELQGRFADQRVHFIGVSVYEDRQGDVAPFVVKMGDSMSYSVALDRVPDGGTSKQGAMVLKWLMPAGENTLPTAFVVDGAGKIAWIGDTLALDQPLEQIVAGRWDLEVARAEHQTRVRVKRMGRMLEDQIKLGAWEKCLETIEEMRRLAPVSETSTAAWRFTALIALARDDEAYAYARKCAAGLIKDDPLALNLIAWAIVDPKMPVRPSRDLDFALSTAERANLLTEWKNPAILDTLALVHFELGHLDKALEIQEQAVALAQKTKWYAELSERLAQFRAAAKNPPGTGRKGDGERLVQNH